MLTYQTRPCSCSWMHQCNAMAIAWAHKQPVGGRLTERLKPVNSMSHFVFGLETRDSERSHPAPGNRSRSHKSSEARALLLCGCAGPGEPTLTFLTFWPLSRGFEDFRAPRCRPESAENLKYINHSSLHSLVTYLFQSAFMTIRTPSMNNYPHPSKTSHTDRHRSLERALANKYIQLVLAHRRRVAAVQGGLSFSEVMRPRCVLTSHTLRVC